MNQMSVYNLASKLNPQNTNRTSMKVTAGNTGYNGSLKDGIGKSLPSRFLS